MSLSTVVFLLAAAASDAGADAAEGLPSLLTRAGETEARRSESCSYDEETLIEQLDDDGKVEGSVRRVFRTTNKNYRIVERKMISQTVEGEPSSMLKKEPGKGDDVQVSGIYSAFHPSQQSLYDFKAEPAEGQQVKVRFAPKDEDPKRLTGTAVIDAKTGLVRRLEGTPSELPTMFDAFQMTTTQAETACGTQATRIVTNGKAGLLFFKMRFRSDSTFKGHQKQ